MTNNGNKNPFMALWSTEPTRRLERNFVKRDMGFTKRGNFNKVIDTIATNPRPLNDKKGSLIKLATLDAIKRSPDDFESLDAMQSFSNEMS
jgi:hypothetical protein